MQPLTVITGVLLGSAASIAFGLAVVAFIAVIIGDEAPRLAGELNLLLRYTGLFTVMTALCAAGFVGLLKTSWWRWYAQSGMWLGLALTILVVWPD